MKRPEVNRGVQFKVLCKGEGLVVGREYTAVLFADPAVTTTNYQEATATAVANPDNSCDKYALFTFTEAQTTSFVEGTELHLEIWDTITDTTTTPTTYEHTTLERRPLYAIVRTTTVHNPQ